MHNRAWYRVIASAGAAVIFAVGLLVAGGVGGKASRIDHDLVGLRRPAHWKRAVDHDLLGKGVSAPAKRPEERPAAPIPPSQPDPLAIRTSEPLLLLVFEAGWCGPCQRMGPTLDGLAKRGYPICRLDIDDPKWAVYVRQFDVRLVPRLVMTIDGRAWETATGAMDEIRLKRWFGRAFAEQLSREAGRGRTDGGG